MRRPSKRRLQVRLPKPRPPRPNPLVHRRACSLRRQPSIGSTSSSGSKSSSTPAATPSTEPAPKEEPELATVTQAELDQLVEGLSYEQVMGVIGGEGKLLADAPDEPGRECGFTSGRPRGLRNLTSTPSSSTASWIKSASWALAKRRRLFSNRWNRASLRFFEMARSGCFYKSTLISRASSEISTRVFPAVSDAAPASQQPELIAVAPETGSSSRPDLWVWP